jgi:hypothetical protein
MHLTVIHPFSFQEKDEAEKPLGTPVSLERGMKIHDAEEIQKILAGENARHVVKTADLGDPVNGTKVI